MGINKEKFLNSETTSWWRQSYNVGGGDFFEVKMMAMYFEVKMMAMY